MEKQINHSMSKIKNHVYHTSAEKLFTHDICVFQDETILTSEFTQMMKRDTKLIETHASEIFPQSLICDVLKRSCS